MSEGLTKKRNNLAPESTRPHYCTLVTLQKCEKPPWRLVRATGVSVSPIPSRERFDNVHHSTTIGFAYLLLCKGVHLREIQRFVDADLDGIDPAADTIPAPPPSDVGAVDPDERPTVPAPPMVPINRHTNRTASDLLDLRGAPVGFWDDIEGLVECRGGR